VRQGSVAAELCSSEQPWAAEMGCQAYKQPVRAAASEAGCETIYKSLPLITVVKYFLLSSTGSKRVNKVEFGEKYSLKSHIIQDNSTEIHLFSGLNSPKMGSKSTQNILLFSLLKFSICLAGVLIDTRRPMSHNALLGAITCVLSFEIRSR